MQTNTLREDVDYSDEIDFFFTTNDLQLFEERRERRITGDCKTYSWEEAKRLIIGMQEVSSGLKTERDLN